MNILLLITLLQSSIMDSLTTPFEKGNGNQTCTYEECITYYETLTRHFDICKLETHGNTSVGKPLHLFIIDKDKQFTKSSATQKNKAILLINNGIHPGEPDGIDASMMFARDVMTKIEYKELLDHCVLVIIPAYNISGMLNRNSTSRVNQNGPESYGFRGNRQHLDLNRDFIKCDSKEALTFNKIFSSWSPELFIDTHVSNGADYQYVMTYIATHPDKLPQVLADYERNIFIPELEKRMTAAGYEMIPYVDTKGETPETGIVTFLETGRYSTGYAALHNSIGFMPETHMLKPYKDRVWSTYQFLLQSLHILHRDAEQIVNNKRKADAEVKTQQEFVIQWQLHESRVDSILFKGYEAYYETSRVTGQPQLYYNRNKPYTKQIPYYAHYIPKIGIGKPVAYVIPQCFDQVIERLQANGVALQFVQKDMNIELNVTPISSFTTTNHPAEGHYPHYEVQTAMPRKMKIDLYKGDVIVVCDQVCNRYIIETIEPSAHDSFFTWNFFDAFMQRKEYFSAYVFEPLAEQLLSENESLRKKFEEKKKQDASFASDAQKQLRFIYENSEYAEKMFKMYPVYTVDSPEKLNELLR